MLFIVGNQLGFLPTDRNGWQRVTGTEAKGQRREMCECIFEKVYASLHVHSDAFLKKILPTHIIVMHRDFLFCASFFLLGWKVIAKLFCIDGSTYRRSL